MMQNGKPAPVPYGLIEKLVESTGEDGVIRLALSVQAGERIQVTAGPFAEFVGELESLSDDGRVRVLLEIMGGYVPVTLSNKQVVATGPERQRPIYVSKRASVE